MLEARSKGKTTDALKSLMKLAPKTAVLRKDGVEKEVPIEQVRIGDLFVVRPGENIPVDGIVREGNSAVNEAALTGESIPADKAPGDPVSAATLNQSGYLVCEATRIGEDTTLSQIIKMVSDAAATKSAHCQGGRPGIRYLRACGYHDRPHHNCGLADGRKRHRFCPGQRYFCSGNQLPLRSGPGAPVAIRSAAAWVPKTASCQTAASLETTGYTDACCWIRPAPSPPVSPTL